MKSFANVVAGQKTSSNSNTVGSSGVDSGLASPSAHSNNTDILSHISANIQPLKTVSEPDLGRSNNSDHSTAHLKQAPSTSSNQSRGSSSKRNRRDQRRKLANNKANGKGTVEPEKLVLGPAPLPTVNAWFKKSSSPSGQQGWSSHLFPVCSTFSSYRQKMYLFLH